jgi:hypothetical protein
MMWNTLLVSFSAPKTLHVLCFRLNLTWSQFGLAEQKLFEIGVGE